MLPDSLAVLGSRGEERSDYPPRALGFDGEEGGAYSPRARLSHDSKRLRIDGVGPMSKTCIATCYPIPTRGEINQKFQITTTPEPAVSRTSKHVLMQARDGMMMMMESYR